MSNLKDKLKIVGAAVAGVGMFAALAFAGKADLDRRVQEGNYKHYGKVPFCEVYVGDTDGDGKADTEWLSCMYDMGPSNIHRPASEKQKNWYANQR